MFEIIFVRIAYLNHLDTDNNRMNNENDDIIDQDNDDDQLNNKQKAKAKKKRMKKSSQIAQNLDTINCKIKDEFKDVII